MQNKILRRLQQQNKRDADNFDYASTYADILDSVSATLGNLYKGIKRGFVVDHIIPCSWFDQRNRNEFLACWSAENLRIYSALENNIKRNRLSFEDAKKLPKGLLDIASRKGKLISSYQSTGRGKHK